MKLSMVVQGSKNSMDEICILQTEALTQKERRKHQPGLVAISMERNDCCVVISLTMVFLDLIIIVMCEHNQACNPSLNS